MDSSDVGHIIAYKYTVATPCLINLINLPQNIVLDPDPSSTRPNTGLYTFEEGFLFIKQSIQELDLGFDCPAEVLNQRV
ncbi:hypothetical protein L2E82_17523 [Cichorium intybus]|uniref:Uncharacterized protein n=1 Tax=Cichorium intybus TaxID=13427 RepID=A0ACB9F9F1_CICIN|nr:hypothetical protein L2E82_17523 [Cichorium intybus]